MMETQKPILVTGSHRCGSTWLANMLALADGTLLVHEPFNIERWAYSLDGLAERWFTYAPALPQDAARTAFEKVLERRTRKVFLKGQPQHWLPFSRRGRLIVKDPIAALSSEWLARNFDLEVIVLVRHPAAFAASLKRVGWTFQFDDFLEQKELMREHLEPYREEITKKPEDIVDQAALVWKCIYSVLSTYLRENPRWISTTHEALSRAPQIELRNLYETLGLKWTSSVGNEVARYTKKDNPAGPQQNAVHELRRDSAANISRWKKALTEEEIDRVRASTHSVAREFYSDEDW